MRRGLVALLSLVGAAAIVTAQQPPQTPPAQPPAPQQPAQQPAGQQPQPVQPPVFRTGTNQVRVDVTVLDHKGDPVTDLTKDDFEVREDGLPQTVETLKLIEANGAAPDDDTSLPIRSRSHAAVEAA